MEWTETERGGLKLLLDGFIYVKKKNLANGWESYECTLRRNRNACKARIKVFGADQFRDKTEHNHPPDHGKANAYKLKAAMKRRAVSTDESPQEILMATMHQATDEGAMSLPGLTNMRRTIRRQRQDHRQSLMMKARSTSDLGDQSSSPLETEASILVHSSADSVRQDPGQETLAITRNAEVIKIFAQDQRPFPVPEVPVAYKDTVYQDYVEYPVTDDSRKLEHRNHLIMVTDKAMEVNSRSNLDIVQQGDQVDLVVRNSENPKASGGKKTLMASEDESSCGPRLNIEQKTINLQQDPETLYVPGSSRRQGQYVSPGILARPIHSTLLKRSTGHKVTVPRAKIGLIPVGAIRMPAATYPALVSPSMPLGHDDPGVPT
nr:uncharacterized protein LOC129258231 [Lytechinus pictus]